MPSTSSWGGTHRISGVLPGNRWLAREMSPRVGGTCYIGVSSIRTNYLFGHYPMGPKLGLYPLSLLVVISFVSTNPQKGREVFTH